MSIGVRVRRLQSLVNPLLELVPALGEDWWNLLGPDSRSGEHAVPRRLWEKREVEKAVALLKSKEDTEGAR